MSTARFRLDDSPNPGLAKVEVLGPAGIIMGRQLYRIRVLEIIRPSWGKPPKVGSVCKVWEGHLTFGHNEAE